MQVKQLAIIFDDFTPASLYNYSNTQLYDYGYFQNYRRWDYYLNNNYTIDGYGDIDYTQALSSSSVGYYPVSYDRTTSQYIVSLGNGTGVGLGNYTSYYSDYAAFVSLNPVDYSQQAQMHGDWVLYSFEKQLDDPSSVQILLFDIDFSKKDSTQYNSFFLSVQAATEAWLTAHQSDGIIYIPTVFSISMAGSQIINELSALSWMVANKIIVIQSSPNVGKGEFDWGQQFSSVLNVGAWNVDDKGYFLGASGSTLSSVDIYANGYVANPSWGASFGTSFATPRVAAEVINTFKVAFDSVLKAYQSGQLTDQQIKDSSSISYSNIVDSIIQEISNNVYVQDNGSWLNLPLKVMADDVASAISPVVAPGYQGLLSDKITGASLVSPFDTTAPTASTFSPADEATAVAIDANVVVTFSENIQRGAGNIVLKKADGTTVATYAQSSSEVTVSGSTLTINPASDLAYGTGYKVEFAAGAVQDLAGNNYAGTTSYNFTTTEIATINVVATPAAVAESGSTNLVYTLSRTGDASSALTVEVSVSGTATAADYTSNIMLVSIAEPVKGWTNLQGTKGQDTVYALTTGLDGSIYVSGITSGALDGQTYNGGSYDAFLTKYSADGTKVWTKLLGSSGSDNARALKTGLDGSIYISGYTAGAQVGQTYNDFSTEAFLTKYSADGTKAWTKKLLGASTYDYVYVYGMTVGLDGSIYVSGQTYGALDGQTYSGGNGDAFLTKYSADGTKAWTKLLGSSSVDGARALTTGLDGSIYISGVTWGDLDGQANSGGNGDAFLTKYSADGTKAWTKLLGSSGTDAAIALTTGLDGTIYVGGQAWGALDGQTYRGDGDAFLTQFFTSPQITFPAGALTAILVIDPEADSFVEGNETLIVTVLAGTSYNVGNSAYAIGTIDDTAPTLAITSSASTLTTGQTATITFTFSEAPTGFAAGDITTTGGTLGTPTVSSTDTKVYTATFTPTASLASGTASITVASSLYTDAAGNSGGAGTTPSVSIDTLEPTVTTFSPSDEATNTAITANIVLTFNEAIALGTGNIVLKTAAGVTVATYSAATSTNLSISGSTLTINPASDLSYSTGYTVEFAAGSVQDLAGNNYAGTTSYNFTTAAGTNSNTLPTGGVNIAGAANQGQTLTASNTLADMDGIPTTGSGAIKYQWSAGGVAISGATASTYTLTQAEVGKAITVTATYTDLRGTVESVTSSATSAVINVADITGHVYHWKSHVLMQGVQMADSTIMAITDANGSYHFTASDSTLALPKPTLGIGSSSAAIDASDALAALKIAAGRNPNANGSPVTPYQYIAADMNEDGVVTSADALAILKLSLNRQDAPAAKWLFVNESEDFWNEAINSFATSRKAATYDKSIELSPKADMGINLVAVLKGDVDGSWSGPIEAIPVTSLMPDYFSALAQSLNTPQSQWGVL